MGVSFTLNIVSFIVSIDLSLVCVCLHMYIYKYVYMYKYQNICVNIMSFIVYSISSFIYIYTIQICVYVHIIW